MPVGLIDVGAASDRLGVSPSRVRQLLGDGSLQGEQVAGRWLIDPVEVDRFARRGRSRRPYAPAVAWRVLAMLDAGLRAQPPADRAQAVRIRRYVGDVAAGHVDGLRARAEVLRYRAHQGLHLRIGNALVRGGQAVLDGALGDRVVGDVPLVEGYVRRSSLEGLEKPFKLRPSAGDANVVVHVVDDDLWPFAPDASVVGPVLAAIDVLEAGIDERAARAARTALREAIRRARRHAQ